MKRKFVIATAIIVGLLSSVSAKPIPKSSISLEVKRYHDCMDNGGYHEECWGKYKSDEYDYKAKGYHAPRPRGG
jgi:hypothetical protein